MPQAHGELRQKAFEAINNLFADENADAAQMEKTVAEMKTLVDDKIKAMARSSDQAEVTKREAEPARHGSKQA